MAAHSLGVSAWSIGSRPARMAPGDEKPVRGLAKVFGLLLRFDISYEVQIYSWRVGVWVSPLIVFFITRSGCRALRRSETHPLPAWQETVVARRPYGSIEVLAHSPDRTEARQTEPPTGTAPSEPGRP